MPEVFVRWFTALFGLVLWVWDALVVRLRAWWRPQIVRVKPRHPPHPWSDWMKPPRKPPPRDGGKSGG